MPGKKIEAVGNRAIECDRSGLVDWKLGPYSSFLSLQGLQDKGE